MFIDWCKYAHTSGNPFVYGEAVFDMLRYETGTLKWTSSPHILVYLINLQIYGYACFGQFVNFNLF